MPRKLESKLSWGILTVVALVICLSVTTFALIYATVTLEENIIKTGYIAINLNDGNPIVTEDDHLLEPGKTVTKEFTLQNTSPVSIWFRFYFVITEEKGVSNLQDYLDVTIKDGNEILYQGKMGELNKEALTKAPMNETALESNETRVFTAVFHLPSEAGNDLQGSSLSFDFVADAVQTRNNPSRLFNDK